MADHRRVDKKFPEEIEAHVSHVISKHLLIGFLGCSLVLSPVVFPFFSCSLRVRYMILRARIISSFPFLSFYVEFVKISQNRVSILDYSYKGDAQTCDVKWQMLDI